MDLTPGSIVNTEVEADVAAVRFGTQVLTPMAGLPLHVRLCWQHTGEFKLPAY